MSIVTVKDIEGCAVSIDSEDLFNELAFQRSDAIKVFGLGMAEIRALRHEYLLRGGKIDATPESIKETFK